MLVIVKDRSLPMFLAVNSELVDYSATYGIPLHTSPHTQFFGQMCVMHVVKFMKKRYQEN